MVELGSRCKRRCVDERAKTRQPGDHFRVERVENSAGNETYRKAAEYFVGAEARAIGRERLREEGVIGIILAVVHFPQTTATRAGAHIDPDIVRNLALVYLPTIFVLYVIAALCLNGYRITREKHEENLRTLRGA